MFENVLEALASLRFSTVDPVATLAAGFLAGLAVALSFGAFRRHEGYLILSHYCARLESMVPDPPTWGESDRKHIDVTI